MSSAGIKTLLDWLVSNGGFLRKGVEIAFSDIQGYHFRALQDFDQNDTGPVVHVPKALTLSLATIDRARDSWPAKFTEKYANEPYVLTRFLLVNEFLHEDSSWWWPYIGLLPQPSTEEGSPPFDTAPWFSGEDLEWIKGTSLHSAAAQRNGCWLREYEAGLELLVDMPNYESYSWLLYKWAATVLSSRCFPNPAADETVHLKDDSDSSPNGLATTTEISSHVAALYPVLVPVLDIVNHDPKANVLWIINEDGYTLHVSDQIFPRDQIYNNYGAKSNEELLMGYGFALENNAADSVGIKFSLPRGPSIRCAQEMIRTGKPLPLQISPAQLDPKQYEPEFEPAVDVFYLQKDKSLSPALLDTIKLAVINSRELKQLYKRDHWNTCRLSLQAKMQLYLALKQRGATLLTSKAFANVEPVSKRQKAAAIYARSQKEIIWYYGGELRKEFEQNRSSNRVWTLEHLLDSDTCTLSRPLRKMTRAVLGTKNPEKLRKQGFHDILMTIVVCLCRLAIEAGTQLDISEGVNGSNEPEIQSSNILERWMDYERGVYCPPPGYSGECRQFNCYCNQVTRHEWIDSEDDSRLTIVNQAYSIIQRAFLVSDLDPMFGSAQDWTHELIAWGHEIWNSEAITWAIEDDDEFEPMVDDLGEPAQDHQRALFLEILE